MVTIGGPSVAVAACDETLYLVTCFVLHLAFLLNQSAAKVSIEYLTSSARRYF